MPNKLTINNATLSDMSNAVELTTIPALNTDGVSNQDETYYQNTKASQYWGYFNAIPDLKSALLMKAVWNVGKGYNCDDNTKVILEHISGWGKDTFDDIIFNMEVSKRIFGDSYCEIIRADNKEKTIINLKPLDPGSIRIVVDKKGIIKRYEQTTKIKGEVVKFQPEDILHLSNNRLADQIHGISDIESLEPTILAENQTFVDTNTIIHRNARPMIMFKLGTDDQSKINTFVAKMDQAVNKGENIYIPDDENSVSYEVVQVNPSAMVLAWRDDIRNKFYRTIGLPQIVPGASGQSTESESKVIYMAFENIVQRDQRQLEQQLWAQLNIKVDFIPPTSLLQDLQNDTSKDGTSAFQTQDINAGAKI